MLKHNWMLATAVAMTLTACGDNFLTGGELTTDPNRPTTATSAQLFVGIQPALWAQLTSDPARIAGLWAQQFEGGGVQYAAYYNYDINDQTTNAFQQSVYLGGGLIDIRRLQAQTAAAHDSLFLGVAQVVEGLLIGTAADMFGDITYTHALKNELNPPLDPQLAVYDSVQTLLTRAIGNLSATGVTNVGPGPADLAYSGDAKKWIQLAHTLKARFLMHTAEVAPAVYAQVVAEASAGIIDPADDFVARFSGNSSEQNLWYQFEVVQRPGYLVPDPQFVALLRSRNDPRLGGYFTGDLSEMADSLLAPDHTQPLVSSNETLLLWSEAAARTGDEATARTKLNAARARFGLPSEPAVLTGRSLLSEILLEQYIADFQSLEAWNLYKRTCTPNIAPTVSSGVTNGKVPARFPYDAAEVNTNTNVPPFSRQPLRNANDPANATSDATGNKCLGQ